MGSKSIKHLSLIFLLLLIFAAANFAEPNGLIARYIFYPLNLLGIDVAMTPITADMMFMFDPETEESLYLRNPVLQVQWQDGRFQEISMRDLDFYLFHIPLILMMEVSPYGRSPKGYSEALCSSLDYQFKNLSSQWQLILLPTKDSDSRLGLNIWYPCRNSERSL